MSPRSFTTRDQERFAELSGDCNPLHLDPVAARRLIFGRVLVHGVHTALLGLDLLLAGRTEPVQLRAFKAEFPGPLGVGEGVIWNQAPPDEGPARLSCESGGQTRTRLEVELAPAGDTPFRSVPPSASGPDHCLDRSDQDLAQVSGEIELYLDPDLAADLFPHPARLLPPVQLAAVAACSRLVGMECPGRHSIFSAMDLVFSPDDGGPLRLTYGVERFDRRFSLLWLTVQGPGVSGKLKTFVRPAPARQADYAELADLVEAGEFAGRRALVIGGSRGLGEISAKLLAAGGAEVRLTYHCGAGDAGRVVDDIAAGGGAAAALPFDVTAPPDDLSGLLGRDWSPTDLGYFASPPIFVAARRAFSTALFDNFCDYYVAAFQATFQAVNALGQGGLRVLYPSTIAISEPQPDMAEYAAAKAAGEALCAWLAKAWPGTIIHCPRLPRLATDQTASLMPVHNQDPAPVMLAALRRLRDR